MSLISSVKFSEDLPTNVPGLLKRIDYDIQQNHWDLAYCFARITLEQLENAFGSDSRDVGLILSIIGFINPKIDKYDDTESLWTRAISILKKYDGESNFAVKTLWKLIETFYENSEYEEADFFGKIAIEIYEKVYKIDTFDYANLNHMIGKNYLQLSKLGEAKEFLQAALSFYAKKFDSFQVMNILKSLEIAYFWRNNVAESKELFENSNEIADATPLCSLGMLCEDENLTYKAITYYKRAVKIYKSKGSPDNLKLADISLKLGKCYLKIDNFSKSQLYLKRSYDIYEKTLAGDDLMMLDIKIHIALCYIKLAEFDEAEKVYEEILDDFFTNERGVSNFDQAQDNENNGKDKVPILKGKFDAIIPVMMNLSALYILDGQYKAAKILQMFVESKQHLIKNYGKGNSTAPI